MVSGYLPQGDRHVCENRGPAIRQLASFGLALTLVTVGVVAAWGMRQVSKRSGMLNRLAAKAPYLSSILLIVMGVVFFPRGVWHFF